MLYLVQVVVGGAQVLTDLAPWTQVAHVALGAATFGVLVTLVLTAHLEARLAFATATELGPERQPARRPPAVTRSGPTWP